MVHREVEVTEMEVGIVGIVACKVELELAAELPAVIQLGRVEVEAEDRVVHAEHSLVVAVVTAVLARANPVGVDVPIRLVGVVDRLERKIAVGCDRQARLAERLEDARRSVGEVVLAAGFRSEDSAALALLSLLVGLESGDRGEILPERLLGRRQILLVGSLYGGELALGRFLKRGEVSRVFGLYRVELGHIRLAHGFELLSAGRLGFGDILLAGRLLCDKVAVASFELGDAIRLSLVFGLKPRQAFKDRLQVGLGHSIFRRGLDPGDKADGEQRGKHKSFHLSSVL